MHFILFLAQVVKCILQFTIKYKSAREERENERQLVIHQGGW